MPTDASVGALLVTAMMCNARRQMLEAIEGLSVAMTIATSAREIALLQSVVEEAYKDLGTLSEFLGEREVSFYPVAGGPSC